MLAIGDASAGNQQCAQRLGPFFQFGQRHTFALRMNRVHIARTDGNDLVGNVRRANAFELRYGKTVMPEGPGWELCEKVLSRRDVIERLSAGW